MFFRCSFFLLFFLGFSIAGVCPEAFAKNDKVTVGMWDSPIDLSHPQIAPFVDEELLKSIPFYGVSENSNFPIINSNLLEAQKSSFIPNVSSDHGTKVAIRLLNGLDPKKIKFIPIPTVGNDFRDVKHKDLIFRIAKGIMLLPFQMTNVKKYYAEEIKVISDIISDQQIDIFNLSYIVSTKNFIVKTMFKGLGEVITLSKNNLLNNNPQTVFSIGAGNDDEKYNAITDYSLGLNRIIVGAREDFGFDKEDYSNYSNEDVDLLAKTSLNKSFDEGTSFSAPNVGNILVLTKLLYPNLKGAQLKEQFLESATVTIEANREFVSNGRALLTPLEDPKLPNLKVLWLGRYTDDDAFNYKHSSIPLIGVKKKRIGSELTKDLYEQYKDNGILIYSTTIKLENSNYIEISQGLLIKFGKVTPLNAESFGLAKEIIAIIDNFEGDCVSLLGN